MRPASALLFLTGACAAVAAAPLPDQEAPPALVRSARVFGDITATAKVNGRGDKVVLLGGTLDDPRVVAIQVITGPNDPIARQPGVLALLRTHAERSEKPGKEDFALAGEVPGASVFIVGEWTKPAVIWELGRKGGQPRFRIVDENGAAGAWQAWP